MSNMNNIRIKSIEMVPTRDKEDLPYRINGRW